MIKRVTSNKPVLLLALLALTIIAAYLLLIKSLPRPITLPAPEEATAEQVQKAWQHWAAAVHRNDYEEATRLSQWLDEVAYLRQERAPK